MSFQSFFASKRSLSTLGLGGLGPNRLHWASTLLWINTCWLIAVPEAGNHFNSLKQSRIQQLSFMCIQCVYVQGVCKLLLMVWCRSISSISSNYAWYVGISGFALNMLLPPLLCVFTCFLWSGLYLPSAQFRFIYTFFLGHERAWKNRPVEESLAQSYSPAAPGVKEEAQCSPGHRKQQAFPINTAPAIAWEHSILTPLTHHVPPSPPSLTLPSIPLSSGWAFWPYYGCFDLFLHQAPTVADKGTLQVSDQLNRTSDKSSDGQDGQG